MKQVLTFCVAFLITAQVIGNQNQSIYLWPNPLRVQASIVDFQGCCAKVLVIVEQWNGVNWQYVEQGISYVNAFGETDCCGSPGVNRDLSDPIIYDAYLSDDDMASAINNAVNELIQGKNKTQTSVQSQAVDSFFNP